MLRRPSTDASRQGVITPIRRCLTCLYLLCTVAFVIVLLLVRYTWQLSDPIPLEPELLEAWLGCLPHDEQVVHVALQTLQKVPLRSLHSDAVDDLRKRSKRYRDLPRVQIVNGSLFLTCPRAKGQSYSSSCLGGRADQLQLLLALAHLPNVDFLVDSGENSCHNTLGHSHKKGHAGPVAIFATETADGCDNVLIPPRASDVMPDNARWAARASEGAWAWHRRMNKAVFRGVATGGRPLGEAGEPKSPRAKAVALSLRHPELLDARFSSRSGRPGSTLNAELLKKGMVEATGGFLTWHEALRYRASLVIDGNTVADRLAFVMASMTAVIKVDSPRREAFYSRMKPYVHYVPVKADTSDLQSQLRWALANETRLHTIARNGAALALAHLSRRSTLCHWTSLLIRYGAYMAGPIKLDMNAVRVPARPPSALPSVIEPILRGTALRPQLSHSPLWPSDLHNLLRLHATPCVGISWRHVCVDISRRRA